MAINNGRYIVTGGFKEPDGTIVEERQWVPATTQTTPIATTQTTPVISGVGSPRKYVNGVLVDGNTFTPAETYKLQADGYYNQGDTALGDAYKALWEGSNAYSNSANQITDFYNQLGQDVFRREMALAGAKSSLADKLYNDMNQQKQYVMDTFGPNGILTSEISRYYDDLGNYLATDAGRQAARIAAQGIHSGASLGAIRAQQNEAYNESFARYVQAKEQEINAKQTIAGNLINYMSTLRKEYGDTTNQYIISQYQRANDLLNTISQSIADTNVKLATAKLNARLGGGGSSSSGLSPLDVATYKALGFTEDQIRAMYGLPSTDAEEESPYVHSDDNLNK